MITFKPIVIPGNRRKDGTYPVKIRVTFKGKSRRLAVTKSGQGLFIDSRGISFLIVFMG